MIHPTASSPQVRCRLAPTPSGYLHAGNGLNFVLTWVLTRRENGVLKLRIDDGDTQRCQPEFLEDIFRQLEWLGLDWDEGPTGPGDFLRNHSQKLRFPRYRDLLDTLDAHGRLYPCNCSRKKIRELAPDGVYPGFCRSRRESGAPNVALRLLVPEGSIITVNEKRIPLCRVMGDFVLWRRDGLPSYQLASLADDLDDRINLIVRGEDLRDSTAAQLFLAGQLDRPEFHAVHFVFHPVLCGDDGRKLAKSRQAPSLAAMRELGDGPLPLYRLAAQELGADPLQVHSLHDLLQIAP